MPALDLASDLIDAAVAEGVREVVLCPGSRSAPLAYAAYAAALAGRVRLHVRVDERSAAFLALGLAKTTRVPAAIITTSGTAVANLHPAVLEAHHAKVPLLVLSADRPAALRNTGANQTTIQPGIFPGAVRYESDLDDTADAVAELRAAYRAAVGTPGEGGEAGLDPGPAHLNVCLTEPLVPPAWPLAERPASTTPATPTAATEPQPAHIAAMQPPAPRRPIPWGGRTVDHITLVEPAGRTLVLLGDLIDPRQRPAVIEWAALRGHPVIAEPFGEHDEGRGVLPHGPLLLTDPEFVDAHAPEMVITVGRLTLSRPVTELLRRPGLRVEAVTDTADCADPLRVVVRAYDLRAVLAAGWPDSIAPAAYATAWWAAGDTLARAVRDDPPGWPSGPALARTLVAALPEDAILFTGPSNPVRDMDIGVDRVPAGRTVVASRGLAGIDGCVSTAAGIALAEPGRPAYALMGDLTFLHDANGLLIGPGEPRPDLTIVVANDSGGGIFGLLEPGRPELTEPFDRLFGTPTTTDLGALARAHGAAHEIATTPEQLAAAITLPPNGIRVIEVPLDRTGHRAAHDHLRAVAARVAASLPR